MGSQRRLRFVRTQTALMLVTTVVLAALGSLSLDLFFVVSFVGFLFLLDRVSPFASASRWRGRLRWMVVLGFVILAVVIAVRVVIIFDLEVF